MSLAQKFRGFISSKATVATLAGVLAVLPLFNGNAQAQEPFKTSHHPSAPNITEQYKPTILRQASNYAEANRAIGIIVAKGKQNENGLTGAQIGEMIQNYFTSLGITSEVFTAPSSGDFTTVGYTVKTQLLGPVGLDKAKAMAVIAASDYDDAYGTHLTRKPATTAALANSRD